MPRAESVQRSPALSTLPEDLFPAPESGSPQQPLTPAPKGPTASSGLRRHHTHMVHTYTHQMHTHRHIHTCVLDIHTHTHHRQIIIFKIFKKKHTEQYEPESRKRPLSTLGSLSFSQGSLLSKTMQRLNKYISQTGTCSVFRGKKKSHEIGKP